MRLSLILGLTGLCLVGATNAANTPQLPQPLTLHKALEWAEQFNPTLLAARIELRRREGVAEHADVAVPSNPQLELGTARREPDGGGSSTTDIDVRLSQEFWIAGQGGLRERAAQSRLAGGRAQLDFLASATRARVRAAFLQALVAERAVATATDVFRVNSDLDSYAKKRLEAGKANRLEANTARIGVGRAQALLAQAENRWTQAHLALAELLAVDPGDPITLQGKLSPAPLKLPNQTVLLRRAIERRGDLAAAAEEVNASQEELKLARRQIVPNLRVFGTYGQEENSTITGGGLSFELPLLHRFGGERKQAAAELDAALLQRDILQLVVRRQVLSALADYEAARARVAALGDEVVAAARQNSELTQIAYEAGELGAPALTAAQDTLINTRRDYIDALDALVASGTDLERATGGLLVMDNAAGGASPE
ncbi:MAG: hypothetical protein CMN28_10650 [Salinisphaeraceae bacterium]|jgi:cobalt-zinc-cadmium efflux system outer membrane protein|nr:hypothetical protein [Salinisphaeraceae bacterium]